MTNSKIQDNKKENVKFIFDKKSFWEKRYTAFSNIYNRIESATMSCFVVMFFALAFGLVFSLLEWEIAYLISTLFLLVAVVAIGVLQYFSFKYMKLKHRALGYLEEAKTVEMEQEANKKSILVNDNGEVVEMKLTDVVKITSYLALKEYQAEIAKLYEKLNEKDGQPKQNKRK